MSEIDPRTDELLSAYLDGEVDAAEAAEVEARLGEDAEARRRLDELRAAAAAVAAAPAAPAAAREAAVSAALTTVARPAEPVVDLAARRRRNLVSAAAVVLAALLAVPVLRGGGGSDDSGETAAQAPADEAAEAGAPAADAGGGGEQGGIQDLGALATVADLRSAAATALEAPRMLDDQVTAGTEAESEAETTTAPGIGSAGDTGGVRCEPEARAVDPELGALALSATATWQGRPAYVLGFAGDGADVDVVVLAVGGCELLAGPVAVDR